MKPMQDKNQTLERTVKLSFNRDDLIKMRGGTFYMVLPLVPIIEKDGKKFPFVVLPVGVAEDLQLKQNGQDIICRDEAEAHETAKLLVEKARQQLAEKPTLCNVLEIVEIIRGDEILVNIIPLTGLPKASGQSPAVENLPPDKDFLDIGHAHWKQPDGSVNAGLTTIREHTPFIEAYRLCRYHQPYLADEKLWPYGVERIRMKEDRTVTEVCCGERWLFDTEAEARDCFSKCKSGISDERNLLLNRPQKTAQEQQEDWRLEQIQKFIDAAHDPQSKSAHQRHKQEILDARSERERERAETRRLAEQSEGALAHSRAILFAKLFPDFHAAKARRKNYPSADLSRWKEEMRRALAVDCRRLKIPSPFNHHFTTDDEFVKRLTAAQKAKSPARAEDIEAVLNWVAKGYAEMKPEDVAEKISDVAGCKLNPVNFKRHRTRKLRLFAKHKGRFETEAGDNSKTVIVPLFCWSCSFVSGSSRNDYERETSKTETHNKNLRRFKSGPPYSVAFAQTPQRRNELPQLCSSIGASFD